jgi:hypothetical protein
MSRLIRISFLVVTAVALCAAGAYANIPQADLSDVPDVITLSPGMGYTGNPIGEFAIHVEGTVTGVASAFVEVEISPDADVLVAWCVGQAHPLITGTADGSGDITFTINGGGCIDPAEFFGATFIAQVRADGVVLEEVAMVSPDAVNSQGRVPTDFEVNNCEDTGGGPETVVGLSDAVFHTRPIKLGEQEICSKSTSPFFGTGSEVNLTDAVNLTPYIKNSNVCACQ